MQASLEVVKSTAEQAPLRDHLNQPPLTETTSLVLLNLQMFSSASSDLDVSQ